MPIESLFAQPAALPTVPQVVQQLIRSFEREDIGAEEIVSQLASDPVLGAKTLRLANSAYFHVSRRVETLDDALRLLGFVMVRNLVLGLGMARAFKPAPGLDLPQFWRYSAHTACNARWLAQPAGLNAELAFTVGLIHGLGQLVMQSALGRDIAPLNARCHVLSGERVEAERLALGYHHGEVGAELAARWRFPSSIAEPLRDVPAPDVEAAPVAQLVHVAAWRARLATLPEAAATAQATCPDAVARRLGLRLRWDAEDETLSVHTRGGDVHRMPPTDELCSALAAAFTAE